MNLPVFKKLDSIVSDCEVLIKKYQLIEQQIDKSQSSIFRILRVNIWKANYQKLDSLTCKIDMKLSQLNFFMIPTKINSRIILICT